MQAVGDTLDRTIKPSPRQCLTLDGDLRHRRLVGFRPCSTSSALPDGRFVGSAAGPPGPPDRDSRGQSFPRRRNARRTRLPRTYPGWRRSGRTSGSARAARKRRPPERRLVRSRGCSSSWAGNATAGAEAFVATNDGEIAGSGEASWEDSRLSPRKRHAPRIPGTRRLPLFGQGSLGCGRCARHAGLDGGSRCDVETDSGAAGIRALRLGRLPAG